MLFKFKDSILLATEFVRCMMLEHNGLVRGVAKVSRRATSRETSSVVPAFPFFRLDQRFLAFNFSLQKYTSGVALSKVAREWMHACICMHKCDGSSAHSTTEKKMGGIQHNTTIPLLLSHRNPSLPLSLTVALTESDILSFRIGISKKTFRAGVNRKPLP